MDVLMKNYRFILGGPKKFLINYGFKIEFLSKNSAFKFDVLMKTTDLFCVAQTKLLVNHGFKIDFL